MDRPSTTMDDEGLNSLLQTLERSLEDLRSLVTCRVCMRPMYEPYTIQCGHSFCYSCLRQWFDREHMKKTCPDCRSSVTHQPAPAYLVRDLTHIFISRSELLPAGDTVEDHKKVQADEAALVEQDKGNARHQGRGLFNGRFDLAAPRLAPIRDAADGVDRCPRCAWEIENGVCESCGYRVPLGDGENDESFESDSLSGLAFAEEILTYYRRQELSQGYNSEDDAVLDPYSEVSDQSFRQPRIPRRRRFGGRLLPRRPDPLPAFDGNDRRRFSVNSNSASVTTSQGSIMDAEDLSSDGDDDDDVDEDEDEDDGDTGSLEDFVVNDDDTLRSFFFARTSAGSSRDATEDIASVSDDARSYSSSEQQNLRQPDGRHHSVGSATDRQNDSEDASDVVLTMPSTRPRRRRQMTTTSSISDTSGDFGNSRASSQQRGSSGGTSTRGPIIIESDSDSPPVRRSRKRAGAPLAVSSDGENAEAQGPSSRRPQSHSSHSNNRTINEPADPNSPITVNFTSDRQAFMEQGAFRGRSTLPLSSARYSQRHQVPNSTTLPNSAPESHLSSNTPVNVDRPLTGRSQSVVDSIPTLQGPEERRPFPSFRSGPQPQNLRTPESVRQASSRRKADRRRLKEDRQRRYREQGLPTDTFNPANDPLPLTYIGS